MPDIIYKPHQIKEFLIPKKANFNGFIQVLQPDSFTLTILWTMAFTKVNRLFLIQTQAILYKDNVDCLRFTI